MNESIRSQCLFILKKLFGCPIKLENNIDDLHNGIYQISSVINSDETVKLKNNSSLNEFNKINKNILLNKELVSLFERKRKDIVNQVDPKINGFADKRFDNGDFIQKHARAIQNNSKEKSIQEEKSRSKSIYFNKSIKNQSSKLVASKLDDGGVYKGPE